jgi:Protein of unknown function (DUF2971)
MDDPLSEIPVDIRAFIDREFSAITEHTTKWKTSGLGQSIPDLFHYTNAETARLILDSRSLWAPHVKFLNDKSEFNQGVNLAKRCLRAAKRLATGDKQSFMDHTERCFEELLKDERSEPYVVSFSADDGDRLSQWRAYGEGGSGISIGFDYEKLTRHFGDYARVLPVTYERKVQKKILSCEVEQSWTVREKAVQKWPWQLEVIDRYCRSQLITFLLIEPAAFKHPSFSEEREFRHVTRPLQPSCPKPKFRAGRFGIVPYVELGSCTGPILPVKKITQGPTVDRLSAKRGIEMLLKGLHYDRVKVDVSKIPFR